MASTNHELLQTSGGFQCESCSRSFKSKFSAQRHIQVVHEGLREFKCSSCDKEFASRDQLSAHEHSKHLSTKPFLCKKGCSKSFASLSARHYHHKMIHFAKKFKCEFIDCVKEYSSLKHLRNHVERDHSAFFQILDDQIKYKQVIIDDLQKQIAQINRLKTRILTSPGNNNPADPTPREEEEQEQEVL